MAFGAFGVGLFAEATGARWAFAFLGVPPIRRLD